MRGIGTEREIGIEARENGVVIAIASTIGMGLQLAALSWDVEASVEDVHLGVGCGCAVGFICYVVFFIIPLPFSLFFSPRPRRCCSWVFHSDFLFLLSVFSLSPLFFPCLFLYCRCSVWLFFA